MNHHSRPDKLSIVVFSGEFEKVHYALVMASGAAAIGTPVTLFFTMAACRALMRTGADGRPGWRSLPAGEGYADGGAMDDAFAERTCATFEELLSASVELGVRFMVCDMGLRALGLENEPLREDVTIDTGGVVTFLNDASRDGAMLFV